MAAKTVKMAKKDQHKPTSWPKQTADKNLKFSKKKIENLSEIKLENEEYKMG